LMHCVCNFTIYLDLLVRTKCLASGDATPTTRATCGRCIACSY
jgi:hypothetical protein